MSDTTQDDLVKLGRAVERDLNNGFPMTCERGVIIQQMADRIEELEAKISEMFDAAQQVHKDGGRELARLATEAYGHD
jgi:hypothetical protein